MAVPRGTVAVWPSASTTIGSARWFRRPDQRNLSNRSAAIGERSQFLVRASRADRPAGTGQSWRSRTWIETPLAVLAQEAEQLEAVGQHEIASAINLQVNRMRRQVDYHLTQARATTPGNAPGARCPVRVSVEGLTRT